MKNIRFIYCIGTEVGAPVKIGFTADPFARLAGIQSHNWQEMQLFWAVFGTSEQEKSLLKSGRKIRGEWVEDDDGLVATMFESDLLHGHFAGPLSPLLRSMFMSEVHHEPLLKGRDLNALARAIRFPKDLQPILADYCSRRGLKLRAVPNAPKRVFRAPDRPRPDKGAAA
jgi:hypothetical protein